MTNLRIWSYDHNDGDWFIAESAEEAAAMHLDWMGEPPESPDGEPVVWTPRDEDKKLRVVFEEDEHGPDRTEDELPAFFCAKYGKGYLASANW